VSTPPLPPKVIAQDTLHVARYTLSSGQIVSRYEDAQGKDVGWPWVFHLGGADLIPPPSPNPPPP